MNRLALLLGSWLALFAVAVAASESGVLIEGKATAAARDGDATIWSIDSNQAEAIQALEGARWVARIVPGLPERAWPISLVALPEGDAACLWQDRSESEDAWLVTRHRGKSARVWTRFRATLREPVLMGRRGGAGIVTESGRQFILLPAEGAPEMLTLPENAFRAPQKQDDGTVSPDFVPVRAVEDRAGGLWFWSEERETQKWRWRMTGLLRRDSEGKEKAFYKLGENAPPVTQIVAWDERAMAIVLAGIGLYSIPLDGSKIEPMPVPEGRDFRHVEQLFHDGTVWHAVTMPKPTTYEGMSVPIQGRIGISMQRYYDPTKPTCALWRFAEGRWQKVFEGLDQDPATQPRGWLRTERGLFVGSAQGAPWFFSASGAAPQRLAATPLFPLPRAAQILPIEAERVLLRGASDGKSYLWRAAPDAAPEKPARWETFTSATHVLSDARGRFWCFRQDGEFVCWQDGRWNPLPSPPDFSGATHHFRADDRDRGWLLPVDHGPTAICDFATGAWSVFPSLQKALGAQLPGGVALTVRDHPFYEPAFSGDGRIGAYTRVNAVLLFAGGEWREWKLDAILGEDERLAGTPFFSADGFFSIPVSDTVAWQWRGVAGWERSEGVEVPQPSTQPRRPELPEGVAGSSGATDRFGVTWWLSQSRELSKTAWGRTVPVFAPAESNPFQSGGGIHAALGDDRGHVLLATNEFAERHEHLLILPRRDAPRTRAALVEVREDAARVAIAAAPPDGAWFTWRLDGGAWQIAADGRQELQLSALAEGAHQLEVRAWNAELTPDAAGATVAFEVQFDTALLLRKLLAQLAADELDQRETAARSLVGLGRAALPALASARRDASPSLRWWLDAVAQAIERAPEK